MFLGTLRAEMNYLRNPAIFSSLALLSFKITGDHQRQPAAVLNFKLTHGHASVKYTNVTPLAIGHAGCIIISIGDYGSINILTWLRGL